MHYSGIPGHTQSMIACKILTEYFCKSRRKIAYWERCQHAAQQPLPKFTASFTVCVVEFGPPPCAVTTPKTCTAQQWNGFQNCACVQDKKSMRWQHTIHFDRSQNCYVIICFVSAGSRWYWRWWRCSCDVIPQSEYATRWSSIRRGPSKVRCGISIPGNRVC